MKIAWFANIDFQEGNAANSRIRAFAHGLKKNDHQVFLFLLSSTHFNSGGTNKKNKGFFNGIYFNYLSSSVLRPNSFIGRTFLYQKALFNACLLLFKKRNYFDVVLLYNPRLVFFAPIYLFSKILRIPVVIEKTELEASFKSSNPLHKILQFTDKLDARFYKYFCKQLIVISDKLFDHYKVYLPQTIITKIPAVVDLQRFEDSGKNKNKLFTVGYLGSFAPKDNINGILKAFQKSLNNIPNLKLSLIGYDPNSQITSKSINSLKLGPYVNQTGLIKYDEVANKLYECDLLLLNRSGDSYSHYGFPTKLTEYLATGIPVICSNVGNISTYLEHNISAYFVEPDNYEELGTAIIERYTRYEEFNNLGENGKKMAETYFDHNLFVPVLESILMKALKK